MYALALRLFPKMLRGRAFLLLLSALIVATASITSINLFIERIQNTLSSEAASFIAADAKIQGSMEANNDWLDQANTLGLKQAQFQQFSAMLFADAGMQLTQVKAVSDNYPLRGQLHVRLPTDTASTTDTRSHGPAIGELWLAMRLFSALSINVGDKVKIGDAEFTATQIIAREPDNASGVFGVAPRVMMHIDDVKRTQAIQPGSRATYAYLFAGEPAALTSFKQYIDPTLGEHHRWVSPEQGSAAFNSALTRAQRFLLLAGSLSVILSGVAIALAAHRFALTQQTQVAVLKTFGVKPRQIQSLYMVLLILLGIAGMLLGSILGWVMHRVIIVLLGNLLPPALLGAGLSAYSIGAATTFASLIAFGAPPIMALKQIAPAQIFRQQAGQHKAVMLSAIIGIIATGLLIVFYSRDLRISGIVLSGLVLCIVVSAAAAHILLNLTKKLQGKFSGIWRLGLANLQRQRQFTALQIFVFASVGLLVLVLFQIRTSLIDTWKPQLENTPNHFVFNIFSDELEAIKTEFEQAGIEVNDYYAMSRGRVTDIAGQPLESRILPDKQGANYRRELNLTYAAELAEDNKVVTGTWWQQPGQGPLQVSAEQQYAQGLGLKIGETLSFSVAGFKFDAVLSSIRSVQWDSMNPNFYMIFDRPIADDLAANWMTSFFLAPQQKDFVTRLSQSYPTVSLIELDETLDLVKGVVNKVSMAIEFILALVLIASSLVLLTSVYATLDERKRESALLRSFGAKRGFVQKILLVEFFSIGLLAGIFACIGAELCIYFIQTVLFDMPFSIHYGMWLSAPWLSALAIAALGYSATVSTTHVPPMRILRLN